MGTYLADYSMLACIVQVILSMCVQTQLTYSYLALLDKNGLRSDQETIGEPAHTDHMQTAAMEYLLVGS